MKGRKPKPTKLKVLQGNPGHRPINKNEPEFEAASLEPPAELMEAEAAPALREWTRIAPILGDIGLFTEADRTALLAYCLTYQTWIASEKKLLKEGVLRQDRRGDVMVSPHLAVSTRCLAQMKFFLTEFGFTPSSRVRLNGAGTSKKHDPFESFLGESKVRS